MEKNAKNPAESSNGSSVHINGNVQGNIIIGDGNTAENSQTRSVARKTVPRKKKRQRQASTAITVAVIGAIATIVAALFNSPWMSNLAPSMVAPMPTMPIPLTSTAAETPMPAETLTPTLTATATLIETFVATPTATATLIETFAATAVFTPTLGVGSSIESNGVTMMYVPAGEFIMGNNNGRDEVKPERTVYLDDFYIDKYEVTNAAYKRCVDANGCGAPQSNRSLTYFPYYGDSQYDDYPVLFVSWYQAKRYCEWRGMRLPTEAEWEKAARGVSGRRIYAWKGAFDGTKLNFCDSRCTFGKSADKTVDDGYADTAPVGSYEEGQSSYEIYDLAGNVWEWIADWYDAGYYRAAPNTNPLGPSSGVYRVLRGGAWDTDKNETQSSFRIGKDPAVAYNDIGFRCAGNANP